MPIDRFKTKGLKTDDTLFVLRDPDHIFTHSDVVDLLEEAERLGFSLEAGSELENLTVRELEVLVRRKN
jgi:hypothetical protein